MPLGTAFVEMAEEKMTRPQWKYELNVNTLLLLGGLVITGVGWGVTWQRQASGLEKNSDKITVLRSDVEALKASNLAFANLSFRVTALETASTAAAQAQREQERTTAQLASDIRVIREIVERLDNRSKRP